CIGAEETQPAGGCKEAAAQVAAADVNFPRRFAGLNVERLEKFSRRAGARRSTRDAAVERLAGFPPLVVLRVDRARFFGEQIKEAGRGAEGGRRPVRRARDRGTDA